MMQLLFVESLSVFIKTFAKFPRNDAYLSSSLLSATDLALSIYEEFMMYISRTGIVNNVG